MVYECLIGIVYSDVLLSDDYLNDFTRHSLLLAMTVKLTTKEQINSLLDKYDTFLFDCDGVVWIGNELLPSVKETMELLQQHDKKLIFVSNNSTKSRNDYIHKLNNFGIFNINVDQIVNSAYSTATYIEKVLKLSKTDGKKIWVLGQSGITDELNNKGYQTMTFDDLTEKFPYDELTMDNIDNLIFKDEINCVVVGLDFNTNYLKVGITMQYLLDNNIPFIATNIDSTFPFKNTKLPGAGSIVEIVKFASNREPNAICGKPNNGMMDSILISNNLQKDKTLMIGDRINTDMKFGFNNQIDTLLVLTGIETEERALNEKIITYYTNKLGDIYDLSK